MDTSMQSVDAAAQTTGKPETSSAATFPPSFLHSHNYSGQAGRTRSRRYPGLKPGLKPWAMICSRFRLRPISPASYVGQVAAKSDYSLESQVQEPPPNLLSAICYLLF
jgi:hypothetical protein